MTPFESYLWLVNTCALYAKSHERNFTRVLRVDITTNADHKDVKNMGLLRITYAIDGVSYTGTTEVGIMELTDWAKNNLGEGGVEDLPSLLSSSNVGC